MKHKILLLLLLLIGSIAWAENGFLSTIPIIHPLFGQLYNYEPKGVYPLPDGSMYVLGTAGWEDDLQGIPWSYGPVVTLIDSNGNLVWHRYPIQFGSECEVSFIDLDDNNNIHYIINFNGLYYVANTSLAGLSVVGSPHRIRNQPLEISRTRRLSNGDMILAGQIDHWYALLAHLEANGDSITVSTYPPDPAPNNGSSTIVDFVIDNEGNLVNLCSLNSQIPVSVLKTDSDGNIVSRTDYTDTGIISGSPKRFIETASGGGYEVLFVFTTATIPYGWGVLLYNDSELSHVINLDSLPINIIFCAIQNSSSHFYIGWGDNGTTITKNLPSGDVLWIWNDNQLWDLPLSTNDNLVLYEENILAVGGDNYNLKAIKLLPNGQVEIDEVMESPVVNAISAYPNPMRNKLTIKTQSEAGENATFYVYNIRGQRVRRLALNGDSIEWDGRDDKGMECPNGVYIIRSSSNNSVNYITKIK